MLEKPPFATEAERRMQEFKEKLAVDANEAIHILFPSKIFELTTLIATFSSPSSPFSPLNPLIVPDLTITVLPASIPTESPSLALAAETADEFEETTLRTGIKANPLYLEVAKVMMQYGAETVRLCAIIRQWLSTVTPVVEEGNNTGVEIQEQALGYLNNLHNLGTDCCTYGTNALQNRAVLARGYLRCPGLEDRKLLLQESDAVEIFGARQSLVLLQGRYLETYGIFTRNWTKICEPKGHRETWH